MKKIFAAVLASLLVLCMGSTVFAASSPNSQEVIADQLSKSVSSIGSSDSSVKISYSKVSGETATSATKEAAAKNSSGDVLGVVEVSANGADISKGITLTFYVSGVSKGDNIYLLHYVNGKWEVIKPVVGDGYVKATFYSLSPVAIVKYDSSVSLDTTATTPTSDSTSTESSDSSSSSSDSNTASNSSSNAKSTNTNTNKNTNKTTVTVVNKTSGTYTSPKTGSALPALPILAVLALMGTAFFGKKATRL